jgi:hypothetical protein
MCDEWQSSPEVLAFSLQLLHVEVFRLEHLIPLFPP